MSSSGIEKGDRISADCLTVYPAEARLDLSSLCQLRCVLCPVMSRGGRPFIGRGVMPLADFVEFVESNPRIRLIELGNSGEVFLNPDLPAILRYAAEKGVATRIAEGANLNDASDEALEAVVRCKVRFLRVAVDGATQATYRLYRVGGELRKVLGNIQKINAYKNRYNTRLPHLILQFITFPHNEHEMKKMAFIARAMDMTLELKINVFHGYPPLSNPGALTDLLGYCDRESYQRKTGKPYMREICLQLWRSPQVNWDGRLLGCSGNKSVAYADYALGKAFAREVNNPHIQYARRMLMGIAPQRDDIPCSVCELYADYRRYGQWFTPREIRASMERWREQVPENEVL
ncbi:radical SAM protein [Desulfatiglans anilini]|uniref:radical SAM protein n=1 Tax=Desulfatiglans anilini TaxID=90728 RepID=UPI000412FDC1|nr:radical SAM protein [Desulfatiglans anilini]